MYPDLRALVQVMPSSPLFRGKTAFIRLTILPANGVSVIQINSSCAADWFDHSSSLTPRQFCHQTPMNQPLTGMAELDSLQAIRARCAGSLCSSHRDQTRKYLLSLITFV